MFKTSEIELLQIIYSAEANLCNVFTYLVSISWQLIFYQIKAVLFVQITSQIELLQIIQCWGKSLQQITSKSKNIILFSPFNTINDAASSIRALFCLNNINKESISQCTLRFLWIVVDIIRFQKVLSLPPVCGRIFIKNAILRFFHYYWYLTVCALRDHLSSTVIV